MYQNDASKQYKENSVYTMSPEELTLMLFNGLIKFLMKAESALIEKDYEGSNNNLLRAQDIINEFVVTLDMQYEVSNGMALMYDYMLRRLVEANVKKESSIINEVIGYAKELRDAWGTAMKTAKSDQSYRNLREAK